LRSFTRPIFLLSFSLAAHVSSACETLDPAVVTERVSTIATQEELDPALALAVVSVESAMGQQQQSDAGAVGIMQLMPSTAADYGVTDRCDPEANIRAGVRYLKKLQSEFDDPLLMLAAYNAGPERVYQKGGIPEFNETAKYVVKVMNRWTLNAKAMRASERRKHPQKTPVATAALTEAPWRDAHVWSAEDTIKEN
jgi:hypothetical protein